MAERVGVAAVGGPVAKRLAFRPCLRPAGEMVDQRQAALGGNRAAGLHEWREPKVRVLSEPVTRGVLGPARLGHEDRLDALEQQSLDDRPEIRGVLLDRNAARLPHC